MPVRQPKPSFRSCPIGADSKAPSDPAAETMPITVLRTAAGTERAATDIAIAAAVHASDVPISRPPPIITLSMPCALASSVEADDVEQRADHHDRAKAVANRHGAGQRLQESPGEILHGQRQREIGHRDLDVLRQRLQEDAEALPQAHAQREHDGGADQDGKRGTQDLQQGHCCFSSVGSRLRLPTCRHVGLDYTDLCN